MFVEVVAKNGKCLVLGSMYKPPNMDPETFSSHLKHIMDKTKAAKGKLQSEVIIGMDHNIDLLKGLTHNSKHKFIDNTLELDLLPTITHPAGLPHILQHLSTIFT